MRLILILTLFISIQTFGQTPTGFQYRMVKERTMSAIHDSVLVIPRYTDTTAANLHKGVDSSAMIIYTYTGNKYWGRKHNPKRWEEIGSASGLDAVLAVDGHSPTITDNTSLNMSNKEFLINNALDFYAFLTENNWGINGNNGGADANYIQAEEVVGLLPKSIYIYSGNSSTYNSQIILRPDSAIFNFGGNGTVNWDSLRTASSTAGMKVMLRGNSGGIYEIDKDSIGGENNIYEESVVKTNDSVYLRYEKENPPVSNTVYTDEGFLPYVGIELTDPQDGDLFIYQSGSVKNIRPFWEMDFVADDVGYTAVGGTYQVDTAFLYDTLKIFRERELQIYGRDYTRHIDTVFFVVPLAENEAIHIEGFNPLLWTRKTHFTPPSWTDIMFATNTGLSNTSQVFTSTIGGGFGTNTGLDVLKLPSGEDGFIAMQYNASDAINGIFGFNTANAQVGFASMEAAIDIASGGDIYRIDGGALAITSCTGISTGDWVAINRTGSTIKLIRKSGALSTTLADWTVCYTFSFSSTADLFIVCDIQGGGGGKIYYPQGFNIQ